MSGRRDDDLLLGDMIEATSRMIAYAGDTAIGELELRTEKADAILFNLAVLGEAAKGVSEQTRARYPDVPWAQIAMTRDKVIHHYHGIDWATVTDIIQHKLPTLLPRFRQLHQELREHDESVGRQ